MKVERYASGKQVLDQGTVFSFDRDGDITLKLIFDEDFAFDAVFKFATTADGTIGVTNEIVDGALVFTCSNFNLQNGAGTTSPVNIATNNDKAVYLSFWIYSMGNGSFRKLEYCIYS